MPNGGNAGFRYTNDSALIIAGVSYIPSVSTNITSVPVAPTALAVALTIGGGQCTNSNSTNMAYLRVYDTTGNVDVGTAVMTGGAFGLPPLGGTIMIPPMKFVNGVKIAATTSLSGTSAPGAGEVNCTFWYKPW